MKVMHNKRFASFLLAFIMLTTTVLAGTCYNVVAEETPKYITVVQPVTKITGDISMIREVSSKEEMDEMISAEALPATAIYVIDEDLNALDGKGMPFATVDEIFVAHNYKIIPAFRLVDKAAADAIATYLNNIEFYDCFVISSDPTVIRDVRAVLPQVSAAIDYTEVYKDAEALTEEQCLAIRRSVKSNNAYVAILPANLCVKDTVQYLFNRQVNVWTFASDNELSQYNALLSGAIGVISDNTDELLDIACNKLPDYTCTRAPLNVSHRGLGEAAPENTIEAALLAYESGATVIELDLMLTADDEIVIMHDPNTGKTCNEDIVIAESTLAQLKELYVNKGYENDKKYSQCRIPTFREFLEAFKDKDCQLFVEIKTGDVDIVPLVKAQIEEYDMYDQCTVIAFSTGIIAGMRAIYPEMSIGGLVNPGYIDNPIAEEGIRTFQSVFGQYSTTINPDIDGTDENDVRAAYQRGISMYHWGWLLRDVLSYQNLHKWGCSGITGDAPGNFKRVTQSILYPIEASVVEENATVSLAITECLYNRTTKTQSPSSVNIISGEDIVNIEGDNMTFTGSGRVTFVLGYKVSYKGYVFNLLTQPITIATANAPADTENQEGSFTPIVTTTPEQTPPDETTPEATTPEITTPEVTDPDVTTTPVVNTDKQDSNEPKNDILPIIIICVAVVAAIVVVAVIAAKKKKK